MQKGILLSAALLIFSAPIGSFAHVSADTATCTPPAESSYGPGTHRPTGSSAKAFVYQCPDPDNPGKEYAGLWVSERFIYYPETNKTKPIDEPVYTYNAELGTYQYPYWVYTPTTESYRQVVRKTDTPPAGSTVIGAPAPPAATPSSPAQSSPAGQAAVATPPSAGSSVAGTGADSSNTVSQNGENTTEITNNNEAAVNNTITSTANSGDARLIGNTQSGDATTGDSITQADVINMLQSTSNAIGSGNEVTRFTYDVDGDVTADLLFDPALISNVQGDNALDSDLETNLTVTNTSDFAITNNLDITSESGDATVARNTNAGNAKTGDAIAIANVVNSIRSAIVSGKSFVGTINITGNLDGDILLPANFIDQLIATNTPTVSVTAPGSQTELSSSNTENTTTNNTNDLHISNTINSAATSGTARSVNNTTSGSASSGSAKTNVTAFNLTGSHVVAENSILVYVNVLGKWTGLIMNAPAGTTAVQLAGNVSSNTSRATDTTINNDTSHTITNTIDIAAQSGNANVRGNTNAGDATTGNAQTAVNVANIEDSSFYLSNWFGILYINVFGTWNGSFGVNTDAGSVANATGGKGAGEYLVASMSEVVRYPAPEPTYTTASSGTQTNATTSDTSARAGNVEATADTGAVLAATTKPVAANAETTDTSIADSSSSWLLPAISAFLAVLLFGSTLVGKRSTNRS